MGTLEADQVEPLADTTTTAPGASDDVTQGYRIGDRIFVSTTKKVYTCVDASAAAAEWKDTTISASGGHPVTIDVVDPTITDDTNSGFSVGDHWVNTANESIWQAISVSAGAAVWSRIDNEIGTGSGAAVNPGELMFGTLLDYPTAGNVSTGEVQYVRVRLHKGVVISSMRTFIDSGGTGSRNVRMGLYSQTLASDESGEPVTRVAQTNSVATNGANSSFITELFIGGNYIIPDTGFYWLAIITDSTSLKFAVSATHRANFLAVRRATETGTTLPSTAAGLSNPVSAVIYVAGVEAV